MHFISLVKSRVSQQKIIKKEVDKGQLFTNKINNVSVNDENMEEYKRLLDRVTDKIDIWHQSVIDRKKGRFQRDEDFIEIEASPTKFHSNCSSSSDDDCSLSKDSTNWRSPKLQNYQKLDIERIDRSNHKIRVFKRTKRKNSTKFRFKRNSAIFGAKKPNSPDIKRRKSFK